MRPESVILFVLLWGCLVAQPAAAQVGVDDVASVRVTTDVESVHPGERFHVAVVFTLAPHWHIYWKNPGASGAAPEIDIDLPPGFRMEAVRYPRPAVLRTADGVNYGYEGTVALLVPVVAPKTLADGPLQITAETSFLVCKEWCLLGSGQGEVTMTANAAPRATEPRPRQDAAARVVKRSLAALPRAFTEWDGAVATFNGAVLRIEGPLGEHDRVTFIPEPVPGVELARPRITTEAGRFRIDVPVTVKAHNSLDGSLACRGLIAFGRRTADVCYELSMPISEEGGTTTIRGETRNTKEPGS